MDLSKIWIEQCDAARGIEVEYGTPQALDYLVGEKFINFLEAADEDVSFRSEIPAFVAEIKSIVERWQLAAYLDVAKTTYTGFRFPNAKMNRTAPCIFAFQFAVCRNFQRNRHLS